MNPRETHVLLCRLPLTTIKEFGWERPVFDKRSAIDKDCREPPEGLSSNREEKASIDDAGLGREEDSEPLDSGVWGREVDAKGVEGLGEGAFVFAK